MTDDEWEQHRGRAILAAFQTGQAVFADTDGALRYAGGKPLEDDIGVPRADLPEASAKIGKPTSLPDTDPRLSWRTRAGRWMSGLGRYLRRS
jgi:hypothetical protein